MAESFRATLDEAAQRDILNAARRQEMCGQIAQARWHLAQHVHKTDKNERLNFEDYPFQEDIYLDDAHDMVVMGSTQWGKSILLECTSIAMAGLGLKAMFVMSTLEKRNKFVKDRIDPLLLTVEVYKRMKLDAERAGRRSEGVGLKHIGFGSVNFVASRSDNEFTSYPCDAGIIDEHQDCDQDNIHGLFNRQSGSTWQIMLTVGNPREIGNEDNQNLDWLYQNSDQRKWHIPCPRCRREQVLGWLSHYVDQETTKGGGILSVKPKDLNWRPGSPIDMKPLCMFCRTPMNRLAKKADGAKWVALRPGALRHGYQLSNLYNPRTRADALYERYLGAKNSPSRLADIWNNQFGDAWSMDGSNITMAMMQEAAKADKHGVEVYRFLPAELLARRAA